MLAIENEVPREFMGKKSIFRFLAGLIFGGVFGYGVVKLLLNLHLPVKHMDWSDTLALYLGLILLGMGLCLFVISFSRKGVAEGLEGAGAAMPATDDEIHSFRLQCLTMVLAGLLMLIPFLAALASPERRPAAGVVFAGIVVLFALQTAANLQFWRRSDEFLRTQLLLVSATTFAIGQGALYLWAAAERLGLVAPISGWATIVLTMTAYLGTGLYFGIRNMPGSGRA